MLQNDLADNVRLRHGLRIQILPTIHDLAGAKKHHFAAFIEEGSFLLVWDDDPSSIVDRASDIERQLVEISWRNATGEYPVSDLRRPSMMPSAIDQLETGLIHPIRPRIFISASMSMFTMILVFGVLGLGWKQLATEITVDRNFARLALIAISPIQIFLCLVSLILQSLGVNSDQFSSSCR